MREIFVKNDGILFKKHQGREELSKSNSSLERIQLDKEGLATYLSEICEGDGKFVTFSAKICGNKASLGTFKWEQLGIDYPLKGVEPPTKERIENAQKLLHISEYNGYLSR